MIVNKNDFFKKLEMRLGKLPEKNAESACFEAANLVKNTALESILTGPKSGRAYKRGGVTRIASAPGQAPANQTRGLTGSLSARTEKQGKTVFGIASASTEYAAMLEFGTRNMAPRPYMQPALDKNAENIKKIFVDQGMIT